MRSQESLTRARATYRKRMRASGACVNGLSHGPATHGSLCLSCRERVRATGKERWARQASNSVREARRRGDAETKYSVAPRRVSKIELAVTSRLLADDMALVEELRPKTRADCVDGPRPCIWVGCRHHLGLDVNPQTGSITFPHGDLDPTELKTSCALDVAEQRSDGSTLDDVGALLNVTRERIRQIEARAIITLRRRGLKL